MFPRADTVTSPSEFPAGQDLPSYHTLGSYNGAQEDDSTIQDLDANGNPEEDKLAPKGPDSLQKKGGDQEEEAEEEEEEEGPKYHELKSSCQQAAQSSLTMGFHSDSHQDSEAFIPIPANSNQARAVSTFDLPTLQKDSTTLAYDLANQECPLGVANQVQSAESRDLYNLDSSPANHKAESLSSALDTQNCVNGNGTEMESCMRSSETVSPSPEDQANTQNFGEIIKESIVETVSA